MREERVRPRFGGFDVKTGEDLRVTIVITEVLRLENDTHPKSSHPHLQPKRSMGKPSFLAWIVNMTETWTVLGDYNGFF